LTQAKGASLIHETVYEDRWKYLAELKKFGAQIKLLTPEELGRDFVPEDYEFDWKGAGEPKSFARILGPVPLKGAEVQITDLRAGAALVLAALAAKGRSEVLGVEHIERGYEDLEGKLTRLGARIEKKRLGIAS